MFIPVRSCDAVVVQACMLTFYPEFEADSIVDNEIILCLDCSNSMKVSTSLLPLLAEFHWLTQYVNKLTIAPDTLTHDVLVPVYVFKIWPNVLIPKV